MSRYGVLRVLRPARAFDSSAVIPAGGHLFPFRTEKLSLPGPMVLGGQPPGRVGRRRLISERRNAGPPKGGLGVSRSEQQASGSFSCPDSGCFFAVDPVAPRGIELAQPAHPLRNRRVRDEQRAEPALREGVDREE